MKLKVNWLKHFSNVGVYQEMCLQFTIRKKRKLLLNLTSPGWPNATSKHLKKHEGGRLQMFQESVWLCIWLHSLNRLLAIKPNTEAEVIHRYYANYWNLRQKNFIFIFGYIFHGIWLQISRATKLNKTFCQTTYWCHI